ncbi:MAG: GNAT family N-acetyltransferase, partial [Natronomonas sp.]|nr:GNAT family N-acetyltransferase [Natronomonas sp.]
MEEHGWTCECIRCREVGMNDAEPGTVELDIHTYEAGGGTEHFISAEDFEQDLLIGFCRLRFPSFADGQPGAPGTESDAIRHELEDAALIRELHVYGSEVGVGEASGDDHQHRGYGRRLLETAEAMAADAGFEKLSVISGIGVREYYREKLEYYQDGPYVSKRL